MSSRDKILETVRKNQPEPRPLPPLPAGQKNTAGDLAPAFITVLEAIGGAAYIVSGYKRIATILKEQFPDTRRVISNCPGLPYNQIPTEAPHSLADVDIAILPAHFGVAENGACWLTESQMLTRVLPFIAQHLVLVLSRQDIVPNMHEAYDRIAAFDASSSVPPDAPPAYGFATFIAGPSKTADIEQSLVLGAHGPRSLIVFLLDERMSDEGYY